MELIEIHQYKYFVKDDKGTLNEILLADNKILSCSCEVFAKSRDCEHIEFLKLATDTKAKIKKVKDPYSWLKNYEKQFQEKLFGSNSSSK
jgi:hypothetical protein